MAVPNVLLNNGCKMPILGLGTWNSPKGQVAQAVRDAIDAGYRHIDCAHLYMNEHEVGEGIAQKIEEGVVKREDLFITSKLWNTFHRPQSVRPAFEVSLRDLGLDYIDMYLIHWPTGYQEGGSLQPTDANGKIIFSDADYVDTWREMEKLVREGLVRSIGVSNFNRRQIERILAMAQIPPATNQVECHPYLNQQRLLTYCRSKNIALTAYSPLGSPSRPWATADDPLLLEDPKILAIAKKYNRTAAQILIRYQIERNVVVIPKSVTRSRIFSNFDVFGFQLTAADVATIDSFDCNGRFVPLDGDYGHPHHPFENDEF